VTTFSPDCGTIILGIGDDEKVVMLLSPSYGFCLALAALALTSLPGESVAAGEFADAAPVTRIGDTCARFGNGFVDVGNGVCGRVSGHVRVYVGTRSVTVNPWAGNGTSSAALRSDGMVPGAEVTHLRVHGGLDSFDPFR
jgi:hypothetical protein